VIVPDDLFVNHHRVDGYAVHAVIASLSYFLMALPQFIVGLTLTWRQAPSCLGA